MSLGVVRSIKGNKLTLQTKEGSSTVDVSLADVVQYDVELDSQLPIIIDRKTHEIIQVRAPHESYVLYDKRKASSYKR